MKKMRHEKTVAAFLVSLMSLSFFACATADESPPMLSAPGGLQGEQENPEENPEGITFLSEPRKVEPEGLSAAMDRNYHLYGYHVLDSPYVEAIYVKGLPILDKDKVDEKIHRFETLSNDWKGTRTQEFSVSNISEINSSLNTKAKVSYSNAVFSGSLESEYSIDKRHKKNEAYTTYMHLRILEGRRYIGTNKELSALLSNEFLAHLTDLENGETTAEEIFDLYGTHLIKTYFIGGRARFNFNYSSSEEMTKEDLRVEAEAMTRKVKAKTEVRTSEITIDENRTVITKVSSYGGADLSGVTLENLHEKFTAWANSVEEAATLCGIGDFEQSMVGIWDILPSTGYETARLRLKEHYFEEAMKRSVFLGEMDFVEKEHRYIADINVLHGKTEKDALKNYDDSYKFVKVGYSGEEALDANKGNKEYIFIVYKPDQKKEGSVTDLIVDLGKNKTYPGYEKISVDLNKGAGGKFVYLYFKRATMEDVANPNTKYIREIRGQYNKIGKLNIGWEEPRITKDLNSGSGGKYVYLMFRRY